jgi:transcriptional regulator with XRE-family HTH domain
VKIDASGVSIVPTKAKIKKPEEGDKTCGLGAVVRHLREIKGRTQAEVAGAIGLERTSIVNIEKGNQTLSIAHLHCIADFLGVEMYVTFRDKAIQAGGVIDPADGAFGLGMQQLIAKESSNAN